MATFTINPEISELVDQLVAETGEPADVALNIALRERIDRLTRRKGHDLLERIRPIQDRVAYMPELDARSADEISDYNEHGAFDMRTVREIQQWVAAQPVLDPRSTDELLGYNEHGLFD